MEIGPNLAEVLQTVAVCTAVVIVLLGFCWLAGEDGQ